MNDIYQYKSVKDKISDRMKYNRSFAKRKRKLLRKIKVLRTDIACGNIETVSKEDIKVLCDLVIMLSEEGD